MWQGSCSKQIDWHLCRPHPSPRGCFAVRFQWITQRISGAVLNLLMELGRQPHVLGGRKPAGWALGVADTRLSCPMASPSIWSTHSSQTAPSMSEGLSLQSDLRIRRTSQGADWDLGNSLSCPQSSPSCPTSLSSFCHSTFQDRQCGMASAMKLMRINPRTEGIRVLAEAF